MQWRRFAYTPSITICNTPPDLLRSRPAKHGSKKISLFIPETIAIQSGILAKHEDTAGPCQ